MFPTFYGVVRIQRLGILLELGREFSCLSFSLIQILLEHFIHFTFALINIKRQSKGNFFPCVSHLNIFIYFPFYFSFHRAPFSSALLVSLYHLSTFNPHSYRGRFAYLVDSAESIESFKAKYRIPPGVSIRYCKTGDWHTQR